MYGLQCMLHLAATSQVWQQVQIRIRLSCRTYLFTKNKMANSFIR